MKIKISLNAKLKIFEINIKIIDQTAMKSWGGKLFHRYLTNGDFLFFSIKPKSLNSFHPQIIQESPLQTTQQFSHLTKKFPRNLQFPQRKNSFYSINRTMTCTFYDHHTISIFIHKKEIFSTNQKFSHVFFCYIINISSPLCLVFLASWERKIHINNGINE